MSLDSETQSFIQASERVPGRHRGCSFKRKSCEDKYKFNVKVLDKLQDAETFLDQSMDNASLAAKEKVSEGKKLINHRQKLIRIADEAEMGWKVVKEYDAHPLADDSEDEKRLYRAESRANRKAKAEKAKRRPTRRYYPYRPAATVTSQSLQPSDDGAKKPGLCFLCQKPGHWKNTCELAKRAAVGSNNKLSISCIDSNSLIVSGSQDEARVLSSDNDGILKIAEIDSFSPVGRLKSAERKWREAGANEYIMRVITEGYSIPFRELPDAKHMKNNKSARDNMNFVRAEMSKLLQKGCVTEVFEKPKVVNPLTVAFGKNGKERLVLDCRHLNEYKFKYKDINAAMQMFEKGSYLFSYDHHIMIKNKCVHILDFQ